MGESSACIVGLKLLQWLSDSKNFFLSLRWIIKLSQRVPQSSKLDKCSKLKSLLPFHSFCTDYHLLYYKENLITEHFLSLTEHTRQVSGVWTNPAESLLDLKFLFYIALSQFSLAVLTSFSLSALSHKKICSSSLSSHFLFLSLSQILSFSVWSFQSLWKKSFKSFFHQHISLLLFLLMELISNR